MNRGFKRVSAPAAFSGVADSSRGPVFRGAQEVSAVIYELAPTMARDVIGRTIRVETGDALDPIDWIRCGAQSLLLKHVVGCSPRFEGAMRRREFIAIVGGAAGWPLAVRAQQPSKLPTIGFLGSATPSSWGPWITAFVQRLRELGWTEGRNVAIEVRWGEGRSERFAEIAAEFVRLKVDVIVTGGNAALAAKQATSVIPIVFAVAADPVGSGLVGQLGAARQQRYRPVDGIGRCCRQTTRTLARGRP
jgi:ABC transporter substrate binding protein